MPHTSSEPEKSVPVPEVPRLRLYVLWLPRAVSVSVYDDPDCAVPSVTVPLYIVLPVPFSTAWYSYSLAPVAASVITCSSFGVPSSWRPPTTVSYARTGVPFAAQITLRGARSASGCSAPAAFAADTACDSAFAAEIFGVTVAGLIALAVAFTTCSVFPASPATTRSPPRTGRPS
ncbi:hypothetical protein RKD40_002475 [Streptomyces ambofaciens]